LYLSPRVIPGLYLYLDILNSIVRLRVISKVEAMSKNKYVLNSHILSFAVKDMAIFILSCMNGDGIMRNIGSDKISRLIEGLERGK
jgi:hypothetical protein